MGTISRAFLELGAKTDGLRKGLEDAVKMAEQNGAKLSSAGKSMVANFENALNPTKKLAEQIEALEKAGKSAGQIQAVLGDKIKYATEQTVKHGEAIDPLVKKHYDHITATDKSSLSFKNLVGSLGEFGKTIVAVGTAMVAARIGGALLDIGRDSLRMATDAVESENLFTVSMGNMADAARKWSKELSNSLGLNEYEIRKNVGTFNVMFESMKMGEKASYDMATGLTQLAYDFASFYNLKPEEAFEKIRAGITGETEPLKRLGILVDEATTKTYAYTHGIAQNGEQLTQQEKVLARYGSIMEQTSAAQGDLARTADSPANAMRRLGTQVDELEIKFGTALLPTLSEIVSGLSSVAGSVDVNDNAMQGLAKSIAFPIMAFYTFMRAANDVRLTLAELNQGLVKLNPLSTAEDVKKAATEMRDAAHASLEWNEKIQKLEDSVNKLGRSEAENAEQLRHSVTPSREDDALATKKQIAELDKLAERIQKMEWGIEKSRIDAHAQAMRQAAEEARWLNQALIEQSKQFDRNKDSIDYASLSLDGYIKKYPGWADAQGEIHEGIINFNDVLLNGGKVLIDYGDKADASATKSKNAFAGMGNEVSTVLTNLSQEIAQKVTGWAGPFQTFASKALASLVEGLFSPITQYLNKLGKGIGDWLGSLIGIGGSGGGISIPGTGGSGSGGSGGGAAGLGGLVAGFGGMLTGGIISGSLAGITSGNTFGQAAGGIGLYGAGMATYVSAATGMPMMTALSTMFTNPITLAAAGALLGGLAIANWVSGPNSYEALAKETQRDLGVSISDKEVKAFMDAAGISESKAWDHRVEIEQSPAFMQYLLALGKTPHTKWEAFQPPLAWGATHNMWAPYNEVYSGWLKDLTAIPWRNLLIPGAIDPRDALKVNPWDPASIPAYKTGIDYVPNDGLAYLHKGEAIVPAERNRGQQVVQIMGPIYGFDDFVQRVNEAFAVMGRTGAYA